MCADFAILLDANVIVDAQVRDLFCRLAEADRAPLEVADRHECRRTLIDKLNLDPPKEVTS